MSSRRSAASGGEEERKKEDWEKLKPFVDNFNKRPSGRVVMNFLFLPQSLFDPTLWGIQLLLLRRPRRL